uniref:Uncharacterized protein n=1 Tax=Arundo donax TaxID=35708 RepID=A0A0A8ZLH4_ARUDO
MRSFSVTKFLRLE